MDGGLQWRVISYCSPFSAESPLLLFPISMQLITYKTAPFPTPRNLSPSSPNLQRLFKVSPVQEVGQVGICQPGEGILHCVLQLRFAILPNAMHFAQDLCSLDILDASWH